MGDMSREEVLGHWPRPLVCEWALWANCDPSLRDFASAWLPLLPQPLLDHSTIPCPAPSMGRLLAGTQRKVSLTSLPTFLPDDNECLRDPCAGRGRCVNRVGSYSCFCYPGYTLATLGATQECQGKPRQYSPLESTEVEEDPGIHSTQPLLCSVWSMGAVRTETGQ